MTRSRPYSLLLGSILCSALGCETPEPVDTAPAYESLGAVGPGSAFSGPAMPTGTIAAPTAAALAASPYSEVYQNGLMVYAGTSVVQPSVVKEPITYPNVSVYKFGNPGRGPICMRGGEYFVETRDGSSDDLMIFLEGGGVCLDEICAATSSPLLSLRLLSAGDVIGFGGVLDARLTGNPFKDYDIVHAPYCDGSIFLGDVDRPLSDGKDLNGPNDPAYQRGLLNLTATFETSKRAYPNPRRIVLAGTSGGGYGVVVGVAMARYYYPDVPLLVVADSGAPILTAENPDMIRSTIEQIGAMHLLPASCANCIDNGHATGIVEWALGRDAGLTLAYMSHSQDHVIGNFFMGSTGAEFEGSVLRETARLTSQYPTRAHRFIARGDHHTFLISGGNFPVGIQHTFLGVFGTAALTGDDVSSEELSKWTLGGLHETAKNSFGFPVEALTWLQTVVNRPSQAVNIVDPGPP